MKIYTRTGDRGETALFGGQRVPKDHVRVEAYGEVDELNSVLGVVLHHVERDAPAVVVERLRAIQSDLFTLGANLATPAPEEGGRRSSYITPLPRDRAAQLEQWIDEADAELPPLRTFILPGGSEAGALLHLARTVCRRAERRVIALAHQATLDEHIVVYLNRLSDYLFTLARFVNHRLGIADVPWPGNREQPAANRE